MPDGTSPIRVLCVDDHPLVREGVAQKVALQPDMTVVAVASNGEEAIREFTRHRPDVTLMDLQLPTLSGLQAIRAIRAIDDQARIVVLTMFEGDQDIRRALNAGAAVYLLKSTLSDELVRVVREVHRGRRPMPSDVAERLAEHGDREYLTPRETQVVEHLSRGERNKEIAASLGITEDTVEAHLRNIFAKLEVQDRTAAITVALRRGIIHIK